MKKFFRFFVCLIFAFSLFTQNVYASASSVVYSNSRFRPLAYGSRRSEPLFVGSSQNISNVSGSITYFNHFYYEYIFTDYITLDLRVPKSDGSSGWDVPPSGLYSFSRFPLQYKFSVSAGSSTRITPYFDGGYVELGDLPDGLFVVLGAQTFPFHDSGAATGSASGSFNIVLSGSLYVADARSASIPIKIHLFCDASFHDKENTVTEGADILASATYSSSFAESYYYTDVTYLGESANDTTISAEIRDTLKEQHQEEIDKADETSSTASSSADKLTGTLSAWEIFTMPFTLLKDFASAIAGDGSSSFTFPSFSMMGYQIWPSYSFDLSTVQTNFPLLYNGLHLVSGIVVVNGFIHYCWRKWAILMGDDLPEDFDGGDG